MTGDAGPEEVGDDELLEDEVVLLLEVEVEGRRSTFEETEGDAGAVLTISVCIAAGVEVFFFYCFNLNCRWS